MDRLGSWLSAARPGQALLAPLAVVIGASYAHFDARPAQGLLACVVVTAGAFAASLGVNLVEHAWDEGEETLAPGLAALAMAGLCGAALIPISGAAAIGYGVFAAALAVGRRVPAVGFDTLGWGLGDAATVLAWGPLASLAGFSSQVGSGDSGAFLAGLPAGLVSAAVLFARHFTHREADVRFERTTPVVSWGEDRARAALVALPLTASAAVALAARTGEYGPWAALATLPLALAAVWAWRLPVSPQRDHYARWERLALPCAIASLLCIVAASWLASPD